MRKNLKNTKRNLTDLIKWYNIMVKIDKVVLDMILGEALKEMMHRSRLTQRKIIEATGYKTLSSISTPIAKNDMNVSTLLKFANAAGYDVMLVRRNAIEPEYPIRIDPVVKGD